MPVGHDTVVRVTAPAPEHARPAEEHVLYRVHEGVPPEHPPLLPHRLHPERDERPDAGVVTLRNPCGVVPQVVIVPEVRVHLPVDGGKREPVVRSEVADGLLDIGILGHGHPGDQFAGIPARHEGVEVPRDPPKRSRPAVGIGEGFRTVDRDQDRVEPVYRLGFEAVEERTVGVQDQRRYRGVAGDLADEVGGEQGFSAVEGQDGVGVLCEEPVEVGKIDIEVHREILVDGDIGQFRGVDGERLPAAVGAAEVTVVGQDEVVVHAMSLTGWGPGGKKVRLQGAPAVS